MKQVFLLGCGFTRALIDKAPLTKDLMHDLPILEFPELIEDYKALSETRQRIKDKLITERLYSKGSQIGFGLINSVEKY